MIPTNKEVSEFFRERKINDHILLNTVIKEWNEVQKKEWNNLKSGKEVGLFKKRGGLNKQKIKCVVSGIEYKSITYCREKLQLHKTKMDNLIKEGKFIRI